MHPLRSPDRRAQTPSTGDHQAALRTLVVHSVQMCLEIASGRRPPRTLDGIGNRDVSRWLRTYAGTVDRPGRIHRIALQRNAERIDVTALIRDADRSFSVMTMQLRQADRRWLIATVDHLHRGQQRTHFEPDRSGHEHARSRQATQRPTPADTAVPDDLAHFERTRRAVDLAILRGAAAADLHRASTTSSARERVRLESRAGYWRDHADRIASQHVSVDGDLGQPAPHLLAMLGPQPADGEARDLWHQAAGVIDAYRRTWKITDKTLPLGTPTAIDGRAQRRDREHSVTRINALLGKMTALDRPTHSRGDRALELSPP